MKRITLLLFVMMQTAFATTIYDYIKPIPFDPHGWFGNQPQLERIFAENEIESVIELGSWAGASTRFFGEMMREKGIVIAVDTWEGSENETVHAHDHRTKYLYHLFLSNVKHAGLEDVIIPIRMTTHQAAFALDFKADLIYVDANHETQAVMNDILNWYPHLNEGGIMCGDDWTWKSVRHGVKKAAKRLGKRIESEENFWLFR